MSTPGETKESKEKEIEGEVEATEEFLPVFLNEQIGKLAKQEKFADVLFVVGDKKFHAHRLILAASSPLFEEMLYERLESGDVNPVLKTVPLTVEIKETDSDSFSALLDCIYSDKVEVTATNIQTLIKVATKYQVEKLKIVCAEFMEGDVTKDNVLDLFQIAPSMLGDEEFGLKFIEENAEEVLAGEAVTKLSKDRFAVILKSDKLTLEEVEVFKLLQKWAAAEVKKSKEKTDVKTVVKDLIKLIRFPAMEIAQLASVVSPSGLLEQTQLVGLFSYLSVTDEKVRALLPDPGFPTESRESGSNWTWDTKKKGRYSTLTNNNLTAATTGSSYNYGLVLGTKEFKNGNHYWEVKLDYVSGEMLGVASPNITYDACSIYSAYPSQCWFVHYSSGLYGGSVGTKSSLSLSSTTGDTIGFFLQWNKSTSNFDLTIYRNKRLVGTPFRGIPAPVVAAVEFYSSPARVTLTTKVKKPTS